MSVKHGIIKTIYSVILSAAWAIKSGLTRYAPHPNIKCDNNHLYQPPSKVPRSPPRADFYLCPSTNRDGIKHATPFERQRHNNTIIITWSIFLTADNLTSTILGYWWAFLSFFLSSWRFSWVTLTLQVHGREGKVVFSSWTLSALPLAHIGCFPVQRAPADRKRHIQ